MPENQDLSRDNFFFPQRTHIGEYGGLSAKKEKPEDHNLP